jgi:hypothetical protein
MSSTVAPDTACHTRLACTKIKWIPTQFEEAACFAMALTAVNVCLYMTLKGPMALMLGHGWQHIIIIIIIIVTLKENPSSSSCSRRDVSPNYSSSMVSTVVAA